MRILLTGTSGRVGRHLLLDGLAERHDIVAYDWLPPEKRLAQVKYVQGSVLDRKELSNAMEGVEAVIHLAGIPYDIPPLHQVFEINVQGTYNALEQAVEHGVKHFLLMSSIMTYGFGRNATPRYLPVDEDHPALSHDTYGMSKLLTESLCRAFTEKHALRTLCFRLTHFTAFSRPYSDLFPYQEEEGMEALHQYLESRDLVNLLEAGLSATEVTHDVFLATAADSGHVQPTPELIARYHPQAELRYSKLQEDSSFISMDKSRRLLGFVPCQSWRTLGLNAQGRMNREAV
jgi:nucleoside-diphosphate-sugar epimerase